MPGEPYHYRHGWIPIAPYFKQPGDLQPGDIVNFRGAKHMVMATSPSKAPPGGGVRTGLSRDTGVYLHRLPTALHVGSEVKHMQHYATAQPHQHVANAGGPGFHTALAGPQPGGQLQVGDWVRPRTGGDRHLVLETKTASDGSQQIRLAGQGIQPAANFTLDRHPRTSTRLIFVHMGIPVPPPAREGSHPIEATKGGIRKGDLVQDNVQGTQHRILQVIADRKGQEWVQSSQGMWYHPSSVVKVPRPGDLPAPPQTLAIGDLVKTANGNVAAVQALTAGGDMARLADGRWHRAGTLVKVQSAPSRTGELRAAAEDFHAQLVDLHKPQVEPPLMSTTELMRKFPAQADETALTWKRRLSLLPFDNFYRAGAAGPPHLTGGSLAAPRTTAEHIEPAGQTRVAVVGHAISPAATKLADAIDSGVKDTSTDGSGVQASTEFLNLKSGGQAVHKQFADWEGIPAGDMASAEYLAGQVAEAVGDTGAAPVLRGTHPGEVYMGFLKGKTAREALDERGIYIPSMDDPAERKLYSNRRSYHIGLLDYLVANPDRHSHNYLMDDDGNWLAIDHSSSFGLIGYNWNSPFSQSLAYAVNDGKTPISQRELADITRRLEAQQPAYEEAGHLDWYQGVMRRLDKFRKAEQAHSMGTDWERW